MGIFFSGDVTFEDVPATRLTRGAYLRLIKFKIVPSLASRTGNAPRRAGHTQYQGVFSLVTLLKEVFATAGTASRH